MPAGRLLRGRGLHGIGVFETLKTISRLAVSSVRKKVTDDTRLKAAAPAPTPDSGPSRRPPMRSPTSFRIPPTRDSSSRGGHDKHVRAVRTKGRVDIHEELEKLRTMAASPAPRHASRTSRDVERRLQDISGRAGRAQEIKRKASVEVPAPCSRSLGLKIHLGLDVDGSGSRCRSRDRQALRNQRLERLTLRLDSRSRKD